MNLAPPHVTITLLVASHLLIKKWLLGNNKFMYTCMCMHTHTRTVGIDFCTSHSWIVILYEERRGQTEFMVVKPSAELVSHTHTHTHTHTHLHESSTNSRHQTYSDSYYTSLFSFVPPKVYGITYILLTL